MSLCANEKGSNDSSSHGSIHSENQMTIKPLNRCLFVVVALRGSQSLGNIFTFSSFHYGWLPILRHVPHCKYGDGLLLLGWEGKLIVGAMDTLV